MMRIQRLFLTLVATGFGSGLSPVAPGTTGSAGALLVAGLLVLTGLETQSWGWLIACVVLLALGVPAATAEERRLGRTDPGRVVIDEWLGMFVSLAWLPVTWWVWGAAFLLFRVTDIFKPPPCHSLEKLPGGWGIMLDDLAAGLWSNLILQVICRIILRLP